MWIALKPFRYRNVSYAPGEEVPAASWPNRKALIVTRRIKEMKPEPLSVVSIAEQPVLAKMKRSDLNAYAASLGIESPEDTAVYPNRETLIDKIEETLNPLPPPDTSGETPETNSTPNEPEDNFFADLNNGQGTG